MVWPLLALGLLAGNEWMRQKKLDELKGEAPGAMGPPTAEGEMGYSGGRGLLADPADPKRQADFALGIMGMPGYARMGSEMLAGAQGRMQQGSQYQQTEGRLVDQFAQQMGLSREQAGNQVNQWMAQFAAQRDETNQRLGLARQAQANDDARLGLARDAANAKGDALPKLSPGWMYSDSAAGTVAMPVPGTPDFERVSKGEASLVEGLAAANRMRDIMSGKEETTPQGNKVRTGGAGTELFGPTVATYDAIHGQLVTALGKMSDAGVINVGELERYEAMLPNPGSKSSLFTRNSTMDRAYQEIGKKLDEKLKAHRQANPWLVPKLPPGAQVRP
jgi:hypothetical protein